MQYGLRAKEYKGSNDVKREDNEISFFENAIKLSVSFFAALLISRVTLVLSITNLDNIAPFGLAFLMALITIADRKYILASSMGSLIGYFTLISITNEIPVYIICIMLICLIGIIPFRISRKKTFTLSLISIFITMLIYRVVIGCFTIGANFGITLIQVMILIPLYHTIRYGVICLQEASSTYAYSNEELISLSIITCLCVSGIGDVSIIGVSIRNILALLVILCLSYIGGSTIGATIGVAMGIIIGIATNDMLMYISLYSVSGMVVGLFKETGKIFSVIAYFLMYSILALYTQNLNYTVLIELGIAALIYIIIPNNFYHRLTIELDGEIKEEYYTKAHMANMKEEFSDKIRNFSELLSSMSTVLNDLVANDRLLLKNKSSAMVENLADRVCNNCDMRHLCWKREMHSTYSGFSELIRNYQESKNIFPKELERKCIKKSTLMKNTEGVINNYLINETYKKTLGQGRQLLASHIDSMSITLNTIVNQFNKNIDLCTGVEKSIRKAFSRANVKYYEIFCFNDSKGRLNIKVIMENYGSLQYCIREILPIINSVTGKNMTTSEENYKITPDNKYCNILFREATKYHISSYAAVSCKSGEKYTGDSYSFGKINDGGYMILLSDGMGSGPEANAESKAAVELIEKFAEAGINNITAINTVNSIMGMKFSEEEKFATLDMSNIDLYTGNTSFVKIGAAASFVKSKGKIEKIKSTTLPIGVLDKPDVEVIERKLRAGDLIISISDGIVDADKNKQGDEKWIEDFLSNNKCNTPRELASDLLDKAKEMSGKKLTDDMTVIVSKVYNVY